MRRIYSVPNVVSLSMLPPMLRRAVEKAGYGFCVDVRGRQQRIHRLAHRYHRYHFEAENAPYIVAKVSADRKAIRGTG